MQWRGHHAEDDQRKGEKREHGHEALSPECTRVRLLGAPNAGPAVSRAWPWARYDGSAREGPRGVG